MILKATIDLDDITPCTNADSWLLDAYTADLKRGVKLPRLDIHYFCGRLEAWSNNSRAILSALRHERYLKDYNKPRTHPQIDVTIHIEEE